MNKDLPVIDLSDAKPIPIHGGRPRKKEKATDSLGDIKFNWRRIPIRRGRPKKKETEL